MVSATAIFAAHLSVTHQKMTLTLQLQDSLIRLATVLTRQLSHSGYDGNAMTYFHTPSSGSSEFADTLKLSHFPGEMNNSCVVFRYDHNRNGQFDAVSPNENFGFRLHEKAVEMRYNGNSCKQLGWHNLTDPNEVEVLSLHFALYSQPTQPHHRLLAVTIEAQLTRYPSITRTISATTSIVNG